MPHSGYSFVKTAGTLQCVITACGCLGRKLQTVCEFPWESVL